MEEKKFWWNKNPVLILIEDILNLSEGVIPEFVCTLIEKIYKQLERSFKDYNCRVIRYNEKLSENLSTNYAVIINPIFLKNLKITPEELIGENKEKVLKEKLPEVDIPFAIKIGKEVCKKFNIYPELHPNFINMIFIEDTLNFHKLPSEIKILFMRFLMAKLGAFKNIVVPYKEGKISEDKVILGTLEGGHPSLDLNELAKRLLVFGSCREVGGWEEINNIVIPKEIWERSETVNSLIALGRYLGEKSLLSSPVEIRNLVKNENLAKFIIRIVNYSRQAEGAFMAFAPELNFPIADNPYDGIFVITCSGKYGTVKTDLTYKDLAPVIPIKNSKVGVLKIEGEIVKGPSVEAEEFTIPLYELRDKFIYIDDYKLPIIRAVIHIHRGYEILKTSEDFFEIPSDIDEYPPVGCGVDLMLEMSKYAMRYAIELWLKKDKKPKISLFKVPNHGTNIFIFWDKSLNISSDDPFYYFKFFVEEGYLKFKNVPQI